MAAPVAVAVTVAVTVALAVAVAVALAAVVTMWTGFRLRINTPPAENTLPPPPRRLSAH